MIFIIKPDLQVIIDYMMKLLIKNSIGKVQYNIVFIMLIKNRGGKKIKLNSKQIITKGSKERYVVDGWQLYETLANESGFKWVIDIKDQFNKFMASFPIVDNTAINALNYIKEFFVFVCFPTLLQTDKGVEYCNNLIKDFCSENNIKYIKSSPQHPQTNGVVKIAIKKLEKQSFKNIEIQINI